MRLNAQQFKEKLANNTLVLSLIGMSNMGKTYWSRQLTKLNFLPFHCDDLIEAKLGPELKAQGYEGIAEVAAWMGQPYETRSKACQKKYLNFEQQVMREIFQRLENVPQGNRVIDTTGSVIHTGADLCRKLKQSTLVVYIQASPRGQEEMFEKYISNPKPVIFGDIFNMNPGETQEQALARCYQKLLQTRGDLYATYADVIIPREKIDPAMTAQDFLKLIEQFL